MAALSIGIRAEHLERHPDRSLAALASDPRITLGLELGNSAVVCHPRIQARSKRERTSFRRRSIPGVPYVWVHPDEERYAAIGSKGCLDRRKAHFERSNGINKIVSARRQHSGEQRVCDI
jgi:hypothetical protein